MPTCLVYLCLVSDCMCLPLFWCFIDQAITCTKVFFLAWTAWETSSVFFCRKALSLGATAVQVHTVGCVGRCLGIVLLSVSYFSFCFLLLNFACPINYFCLLPVGVFSFVLLLALHRWWFRLFVLAVWWLDQRSSVYVYRKGLYFVEVLVCSLSV